jgi:catechol-2,3-dioxygenase
MDLHFAMGVPDHEALEAWRTRLLTRGVEVEGPIDHGVCTSIYFHDPNGYRLEFAAQNSREHAAFQENQDQAHAVMRRWVEYKRSKAQPVAPQPAQ